MITADKVREILNYDPTTGALTWRVNKGRSRAGQIAGRHRADGYVAIKLDQKTYLGHRLIWLWVTGCWPKEIDHIDGNPANNKIDNLRVCTRIQNLANRRKKAGKLLPKGVRFDPRGKSFSARIRVANREIHLGRYDTPEAASAAYVEAAIKYYGEFAAMNGERVFASD